MQSICSMICMVYSLVNNSNISNLAIDLQYICQMSFFQFNGGVQVELYVLLLVAEMMELINQIKLSEFFQSMIIEPTPAPQPDPIASDINAHVEPIAAEMVPQMNPAIQHPPSTASGVSYSQYV